MKGEMPEKKTLAVIVEEVLKEDARARRINEGNWFIFQVFRRFPVKFFFDYKDLDKIPSIESILKTRRDILHKQNKFKEDLPEDPCIKFEIQEGK